MPEEKELKKAYEEAPTKVKELLSSELVIDEVQLIGKRNGLDLPLVEVLLNEIGLVLLKFEQKNDFAKNLEIVLEINEQRARAIAAQIDEKIFAQIEEDTTSQKTPPQTEHESTQKQPLSALKDLKKPQVEKTVQKVAEKEYKNETRSLATPQAKPNEVSELEKDLTPLRTPVLHTIPPQPKVPLVAELPQKEVSKETPTDREEAASLHTSAGKKPSEQRAPLHSTPLHRVPKQAPVSVPKKSLQEAQKQPTEAKEGGGTQKQSPQNMPIQKPTTPSTPQNNTPKKPGGILESLRDSSKKMSIRNIIADLEQ